MGGAGGLFFPRRSGVFSHGALSLGFKFLPLWEDKSGQTHFLVTIRINMSYIQLC